MLIATCLVFKLSVSCMWLIFCTTSTGSSCFEIKAVRNAEENLPYPKSPVQSSVFMINNTTVHWWMQYWSSELYFHFPRVQICLSATQTMNAETLRVPLDQHLREINVWSMYDAFFNPEQNISQAFTKTLWCMSEVCPQVTWLEVESDHKSGDKKKGTSNLTFPLVPMTCTLTSDIPQIRELEIYPTI